MNRTALATVLTAVIAAGVSAQDSRNQSITAPSPTPTISESSNTETFGVSDNDADDAEPTSQVSETERSNPSPQSYEIVRGDTLWDICKKILGDPWYWPKLWALNDYISNPHLIYPGNVIRFFPGSEIAPPQLTIEGAGAKPTEQKSPLVTDENRTESEIKVERSITVPGVKSGVLRVRPVTFVTKKLPVTLGKISYSGMPKLELVLGDSVYLEFSKKMKVEVGDKFHVIENLQETFDPEKTRRSYGWMIRKNAVVQVKKINPTSIEARIIAGDRTVHRDDSFIAYSSEIKEVTPIDAKKLVSGKIIATENQQILISQNEFVFLNIGKSAGLTEGMRFYVVKKGDGVLEGADDGALPYIVIGNLVVVEVFDGTATAYVSGLKETLEVGFQIRSLVN